MAVEALSSCRFFKFFSSSSEDSITVKDNREAPPDGPSHPILFVVDTLDMKVLLGIDVVDNLGLIRSHFANLSVRV